LFSPPRWDGSSLQGKTILLHHEQGFGDTLHFIRYAEVLRDRGATVLAVVQSSLAPLIRTCPAIAEVIPQGAPVPRFDCWAPMLSVPGLCRTDLASIPAPVPYLQADAERVNGWRGRLAGHSGFKVGICWQGSPRHSKDRQRSAPLSAFLPLAQVPGVQLFSLQYGAGAEQVRALPSSTAIVDLSSQLDESAGAFLDTAAVVKNLDLIITVDTALAHLAGALGVPVWVVLPHGPDWRWLLGREDTPWYPTMRLFRQTEPGNWSPIFARTADELARHIEAKRAAVSPADAANDTEAIRQAKWADTLVARGDHAGALPFYREAVRLKPDYFEAHNNLGVALNHLGQMEAAADSYRRAVELRPDFMDGHNNLGVLLSTQQRFAEAVTAYEKAIRLQPNFPKAHNNLGTALAALGRIEEALACYQQAIALDPEYVSPHLNRSLSWLLQGRFAEGWPEYEWRWKARVDALPNLTQPRWDGGPLGGKTILLCAEQGLGDSLQFVRYAKLLQGMGARVMAAVPAAMVSLISRCPGVAEAVALGGALPYFDVWAPMLSVPGLCRTDATTIPNEVPYLVPEPGRLERWRGEVTALAGFKIGIGWQGNPKHAKDRFRSLPLSAYAPLAAVPGVRLVSLQKGDGVQQLAELAGRFSVHSFGDRVDADAAFEDTAAIMKHLDLVVTSDSALAHLAGGLGVPVWLATPFAPDWRWQLGRGDSTWYPSMRLFRQKAVGNWEEVLQRMAAALREKLSPARRSGPIQVELAPGELIDKITILEIKQAEIQDKAKLRNVAIELESLISARDAVVPASPELDALASELRLVNQQLWNIEDDIRRCEQAGDFGPRFIALARAVYKTNDHRAALKRQINDRLGSRIVEEKSYQGAK
jgi:tetratricopeptide (TPR) repeat protein